MRRRIAPGKANRARRTNMRALNTVFWIAAQAVMLSACTFPAASPFQTSPDSGAARAMDKCEGKIWWHSGKRVQMEAEGEMPMSISTFQYPLASSTSSCVAFIEIHSKTALAAMMGPPIVTEQRNWLTASLLGAPPIPQFEAHGVINALGYYSRAYGTSRFAASGVVNYAGIAFHEDLLLDGASLTASAILTIYARDSDIKIGELIVPHATVSIGTRHVGQSQIIDTARGRLQCFPITYEKRTSLGTMEFLGETYATKSTIMQVTDWYCPSEDFVMLTEAGRAIKCNASR